MSQPIVLAYSGGLDTSFLVPWLKEQYQRPVITVTVDTGGIDATAAKTLEERALALGASEHHQVDARADYFEQVLRFLIMGNVRRGQLYPLCVGAERVMQAQTIALMARRLGTGSIAHGCTAAGNDQVRFEVALRTLAPELEVIAPVRDRHFKRQEELEFLQSRNLPVPPFGAAYSINRGLWGVSIGGKETLARRIHQTACRRAPRRALRAWPALRSRRQDDVAGRSHRSTGDARRALRHRSRHPSG
jgi:argininosuccinate synthase